MLKKVVERDPRSGATREAYKDMGPGRAVPGHGRPLRLVLGQHVGPVRAIPATGQGR